jgi:hypothetical protein
MSNTSISCQDSESSSQNSHFFPNSGHNSGMIGVKRTCRLYYMDTLMYSQPEGDCSSDTSKDDCPTQRNQELPPEVLYNILADVVSGYVDLFITEPRQAISLAQNTEPQQGDSEEILQSTDSHVDGILVTGFHNRPLTEATETTEKLPYNIVISLLSTSFLFRDITLKILRDGFGIDQTTVERCVIFEHIIIKCYYPGLMCLLNLFTVHPRASGIY